MSTTSLSIHQLEQYLNTLLNCDALEMIPFPEGNSQSLYIAYMLNDAVENYFILKNCRIMGDFSKTLPSDTVFDIIEKEELNKNLSGTEPSNDRPSDEKLSEQQASGKNHALILHKANNEVLTIWFSDCVQVLELYQYHRIGHFWRKGQEHWRRLVYIIGTIYEKHAFLGSETCNDLELKLMHLMEFAPFRYFSPIHDSLDSSYPDTPNGIFFMHQIALEAGDRTFAKWIRIYRKCPLRFIARILTRKMEDGKCEAIYQLINQKIEEASLDYAIRNYGSKKNAEIEKIRTKFTKELHADGFSGCYPNFQKGALTLAAMEEHPFIVSELEYENFDFRIRGMVTEGNRHSLY